MKRFSFLIALCLAGSCLAAQADAQRFSPASADRHKLRVDDPAVAGELIEGGGRLIADYGSFQLIEANSAAVTRYAASGKAENRDEENRILLNAGDVDTTADAAKPLRRAPAQFPGRRLHLVQFAGPVKPEWVEELEKAGLRIVTYIPHNAYLVYGDQAAIAALSTLASSKPFVQWQGAYGADDRIQPRARNRDAAGQLRALDTDLFAIQLVDDPAMNAATLAMIDSIKLAPVFRESRELGYCSFAVRLPPDQVAVLAAQPDVVSINTYIPPKKFDERQDQIVAGNLNATGSYPTNAGYLAWLYSKGFTQDQFTASGFVVDVCDSGLDVGTTTPNHFGLYALGDTSLASRVAYARLEGTANSGSTIQGCDGHGTLNAHIIGGFNDRAAFPHADSAGYRYGLGVCPFVRLGSSVIFDPSSFTDPDYEDMLSRAYRDGARISSDSWGADTAGDYDIDAQRYDSLVRDAQPSSAAVPSNGNQEITIVFAAGNAGSGAQTVGSPGTAKNVITVGAAENVHSHASTNGGASATGADGCDTPDSEANSANDIATFSSRGPCADLRRKPEIVAPGTHITGGVAQQTRGTTNGNDLACFDGTGVCGLPGGGTAGSRFNFFPTNSGQQFWSTSSGTSHSTPAVAGGCALIRQYFLNLGLNAPSPAMVKACLMNSARHMTGTSANDTLWSNSQGMGMMNLGLAFDGASRVLKDQLTNELFTATGQSRQYVGTVSDTARVFRVTLSWTDAPGPTTGNAYKNNLDLLVRVGGQTYKGNVFSGAYSTNGGTADVRNNTESVFLRAGQTGVVAVIVTAANINSDGVPNYGGSLDQDFALVVYNVTEGASNQPPVLDPIGDRSAATNAPLTFAVTASDPFDGDTVSLWATGLPPWATFTGATNAGGVTNTFSGTSTSTGTWTTTFYAGDADGTNSETITIRVTEGGGAGGLFISQYYEGASNDKWIELYNAGSSNIDLSASGYRLGVWANANRELWKSGTAPGSSMALSGTIAASATYLVKNSLAALPSYAVADLSSGSLTHNGDDSVVLYRGGTYAFTNVVDAFGLTANTAADRSFVRAATVLQGTNVDFIAGQWTEYTTAAVDAASPSTAERLGYHTVSGGTPANTPPVLNPIGNRSVVASNTLQFSVTATPTESDAVTLTVSNAPAGTWFSAASESGTFYWTNASPVGVYTTTFYAADAGGVDFEQILISVVAAAGGGGGGTETFSNSTAPAATYGSGSYVGDGSIQWTYSGARSPDATYRIDGASMGFGDSTRNPREVYSSSIAGGVGDLSVKYLKYFTGAGTRSFEIYVNSTLVGTVSNANNTAPATQTFSSVNIPGDVVIRVTGTGGKQFVIDTLSWTSYSGGDDADGDGMPDAWEQENFGSLTNTAAGDWDGDRLDNLSEYISGTQPTNDRSYLRFEAILLEPSPGMQFGTVTGRTYRVDYRTNLLFGEWGNLASGLVGSNDVRTVNDTNGFEHRTYRLGVQRE